MLEIQQNSDATYRLYDWQRVGDDGKMRELHVDKAADVSNRSVSMPSADVTKILENGDEVLAECEYFKVIKRTSDKENKINGMSCVTVTEGVATLGDLNLKAGDTVFVPFVCKDIPLKISGEAVIVE